MNKKNYPDPNFYAITDRMNYTIRGEVDLFEQVEAEPLQKAVDTAFQRYPYFSVQVVLKDNILNVDPNPRPHNIIHSADRVILGTEEVNYHLVVVSYYENKIFFNVSHSITDGAGRAPLTKTVLYYYLKYRHPDMELDPEGIYLAGEEAFEDERSEPVPLEEIMNAQPTYYKPLGKAFKLTEKGTIKDNIQTEFRFRIDEKEFMKLNKSQDASPSVLVSALLAQMTWQKYPEIEEDVIINLCMNMRSGLHNKHSHLPLFTCIPLNCQPCMKDFELDKICTCLRGMVMIQSQEENVQYLYKQYLLGMEQLHQIPDLKEKREIVSASLYQIGGLLSSTFIVSYVGKNNLGSLYPYVEAMYTTVDAIPNGGVIVEITSADGYFYFTFMQDFSTDEYINSFCGLLRDRGLTVEELGSGPILAPGIRLPEE